MEYREILYDHSSIVITMVLFGLIVVMNEVGFRAGRYVQGNTDTEIKALTGSIQASVLGLLALLLGFTFNMSMQRYDARSMALIDEVNSIGTAMLRMELIPERFHQPASDAFDEYIEQRVAVGQVDLTEREERRGYNQRIAELQGELWALATAAAEEDPRPITTGAFSTALTQLIDAQGKRHALLQMHVPEVVLILLFIVFIASGGILGYSAGLSGKRVIGPITLVALLISLIVFIIIDLDRPKRGLIQVDQSYMIELRTN